MRRSAAMPLPGLPPVPVETMEHPPPPPPPEAAGIFSTGSEEVLVTPSNSPEIVTVVVLDTATVVTLNVALVLPPDTVTLDGTVATEVLLLDSDTTAPPLGAGPFNVTVPVELSPPVTGDGLKAMDVSIGGGTTESGDVLVTPSYSPEIVTAVVLDTPTVVT